MTAHRAVIEAGPGVVRRLCCRATEGIDAEVPRAALEAIDDLVALVDRRPVAVDAVWQAALRPLADGHGDGMIVVHPSWWSSQRVDVIKAAARAIGDAATTRPRTWLLQHSAAYCSATVVEITDLIVVVTGARVFAVPRRVDSRSVADEVARGLAGMAPDVTLLDVTSGVDGAAQLASLIADAVRSRGGQPVLVQDARLARLARRAAIIPDEPGCPDASDGPDESRPASGGNGRSLRVRTAVGLAAVGTALAVPVLLDTRVAPVAANAGITAPTTVLLEGRVALTIPADWSAQRVIGGPGSARVQITAPTDPEVALHVTQSQVPGETLDGAAERLRRAIDAEPPGVFVEFNPSGVSAGRPAVTYREIRVGHDVRWTVLLDGSVRISIGCQSRPDAHGAVRDACEQAVRSAHAVG